MTSYSRAYKKEKYGKKKERLHAMCKIKINESTIAETANQMFCTYNSVRNWLDSFEKYGLEGLEDLPRSCRPPLISHKKLQKIERTFKKISDGMTPKKLIQFIFYRTRITYHITHVASFDAQMESKTKGSTKGTCTSSIQGYMPQVEKPHHFTHRKGKKERFYSIHPRRGVS